MGKEFVLTSITLYNMFNYRKKHKIDFTGGREGNVFLFDVKNGGGKTSLFFSMKWGFYGFDSGVSYVKDGLTLKAKDFMNQDEREEGSFRVVIEFDYDGDHMQLRRSCPDYRKEDTELTLTVNGMAEQGQKAKEHVMRILPPDYGDFFMFDGETLQKIASQQGDRNKTDNVMKLLGLNQLRDLKNNLQSIQKAISGEFSRVETSNSGVLELTKELDRLQNKQETVGQKLAQMREDKATIGAQISTLEEKRRLYSNLISTVDEITVKRGELTAEENRRKELRKQISECAQDAFMLFMEPDVKELIGKYEAEMSRLRMESYTDRRVSNEFLHIQSNIVKEHMESCPVCSSILTDDVFQYLTEIVSQSKDKGESFRRHKEEVDLCSRCLTLLRMQHSRIPDDLADKCNRLFQASEKIDALNTRISELNQIAADSDIGAVGSISKQLTELYKKQSRIEKDIFHEENVLQSTEKKLAKTRKDIKACGHLSGQQEVLALRMTRLDRIIKNLDTVITKVSNDKRADILAEANRVFMSITNKQDAYKGLAYDDSSSFSMHIVRKDGERSVLPSSGENHVLAISFLISLSLNTERLTPMMMDTPLSRLDDVHKPNIGKMLASLDNQVIFLAQPGELDDNTRKMLMPAVSKMYSAQPTGDNTACITEVVL